MAVEERAEGAKRPAAGSYDPITAEVASMAMQSIVLEMGITVERTSGSPAATDAKDYSCVITKADGGTIAYYGNNLQHLGDSRTGTQAIVETFEPDDIHEGDVFVYNDPFSTGALHQADIAVQTPVFHDGRLVAWMFTNIHMLDIGGMSPSGFAPESRDVYGEGLRMPPVKIVEDGVSNEAVWELVRANVRTPLVLGDIRSQIAANHVGRKRLLEVVAEHGGATFERYVAVNESLVEDLLAQRIGRIPPGIYEVDDWVEYDAFGGEEFVPVRCRLEVADDARLIFDFSGSGPQVPGYCNSSEGALLGSVMPVILAALLPEYPVNAGVYSRFEVRRGEPGRITNPTVPAGVSGGHMETGPRALRAAHTALVRAMALSDDQWVRERAYALGGITVGVIVLTGHLPTGDRGYAFMLDQQSTGHGALPHADGVAFGGIDYSIAGREPDVETAEAAGPILYLWRREVADSGGAGAFRGGNSLETAFVPWKVLEAEISHACAGGRIPTRGTAGGYPGGTTFTEVYREALPEQPQRLLDPGQLGGSAIPIPGKCAVHQVGLRDAIRQVIAAGSGWGDPLLRAVDAVARDLERGEVTPPAAAAVYGIVLGANGDVDRGATEARRRELRSQRIGGAEPAAIEDPAPRHGLIARDGRLACGFCAEDLGPWPGLSGNGRTDGRDRHARTVANRHLLHERLRSWRTPIEPVRLEDFNLVERVCPGCGTLLEVDVEGARSG